jgi:hypothetical protein
MLCSATAHFSVCASRNVSTMFFDLNLNGSTTLSNINLATLTRDAVYFHWWQRDTLVVVFSQHSAESAICCLGVRYKCNRGGSFLGLGGSCYSFKNSSYLLGAVSIFLENGGEKFQFLSEGILVTKSFGSVCN